MHRWMSHGLSHVQHGGQNFCFQLTLQEYEEEDEPDEDSRSE
jgi:hypothetical protein